MEPQLESTLGTITWGPLTTRAVPLRAQAGGAALIALGAFLVLFGGCGFFLAGGLWWLAFTALGGPLLVVGVALERRRRAGVATVALHERALTLTRRGRRQVVPLASIEGLVTTESQVWWGAVLKGTRFELRGRHGPERFALAHYVESLETGAGLGPLTEALLCERTATMEAAVGRGERVAGRGWALSSAGLTLQARTLHFGDITRASLFDGQVQVFAGSAEPALRTPATAPDALPLLRLLARKVEKQPTPVRPELGYELFRRRPQGPMGWVGLGLAACLALLGLRLAGSGVVWGGLVALGLSVVSGVEAVRLRRRCVQFREEGFIDVGGFWGPREVPYTEVQGMIFALDDLHHGTYYAGTITRLSLTIEGRQLLLVIPGRDRSVQLIAERIEPHVRARMRAALERDGRVPWTPGTWLSPDGVQGSRGLLSRSRKVGFSGLKFAVAGAVLELFEPGQKRAAIRVRRDKSNYLPGFQLLLELALLAHSDDRAS